MMPESDIRAGWAGPTREEWRILGFTGAYMGVFLIRFLTVGNHEFMWYLLTMAVLIALFVATARRAQFPVPMLWALSLWGLAHMSGGALPVGNTILYDAQLLPLAGAGELAILKYDQAIHAYGYGITAWLLWHLMDLRYPALRGTWTILIYPTLGAMGLGAANEIVEFAAVMMFQATNVGGYYNTALDMVFNTIGAVGAMAFIALMGRRRGAGPQ